MAHVEIHSPEWTILVLEMVKGLLSSKSSNQQVHFDHKVLRARLPLDNVKWPPALYEHTWLRAFFQYCELFLGGEGLFEGREKERGIAMIFFFFWPAKNTSYAGCFSHCAFFLSLGTNTAFLYQKEGCSFLQTWGRGILPLLSLSYSFVGFIAWFLKISKALTVVFSVFLHNYS